MFVYVFIVSQLFQQKKINVYNITDGKLINKNKIFIQIYTLTHKQNV